MNFEEKRCDRCHKFTIACELSEENEDLETLNEFFEKIEEFLEELQRYFVNDHDDNEMLINLGINMMKTKDIKEKLGA